MIRINPFKKILLIATLFSNIKNLNISFSDECLQMDSTIGHADTQLVGSYEAREMRWVLKCMPLRPY